MSMGLVDIEEILPAKIVDNSFFGDAFKENQNRMFKGCVERRHIGDKEQSVDYFASAAKKLLERNGLQAQDVDMILTNVSVPDHIFTGSGAILNKKIGGKAKWIFDLHNTGCVSFIYMMEVAKSFMLSHGVKRVLLCSGQTAGGRIFAKEENKNLPQSAIPGDGFAVALFEETESRKVLATVQEVFPENSEDMKANYAGKDHWEARSEVGNLEFPEEKVTQIIGRGNRLVPKMIYQALKEANLKVTELDYLITNQPNYLFLRNWREAVLLPQERHLNTFSKYSNLFGAGIPITLAEANKEGKFKEGDLICLAGFSHAGDYAAATLIRW
ncbi:3-oxoacyl-ACP synthase III family protein [Halobacteriovorax sp. HLS]|uniref:3-oxoacyl-ACP synthase III family protein n=1 Tax=Halobacteriovorax sp. HLS TaxID=2234000 RepID=UPI000FDC9DFD|nr:3-oxoacyl-[acyl-carrier-protein] synthase III C-terminal domain-containing protein [Halobacteriovorax sp. HLS]